MSLICKPTIPCYIFRLWRYWSLYLQKRINFMSEFRVFLAKLLQTSIKFHYEQNARILESVSAQIWRNSQVLNCRFLVKLIYLLRWECRVILGSFSLKPELAYGWYRVIFACMNDNHPLDPPLVLRHMQSLGWFNSRWRKGEEDSLR